MQIDEKIWKQAQKHLGYDDEEMEIFMANPVNSEIIMRGMAADNKEIVCEVVESKGCMSGHKKGDKIYFDMAGNIKTKISPEMICMHVIEAGTNYIYTACELVFQGVDPEKMRFKRFGCLDVGVQCGGWGNVICEIKVVEKN